MYPGYNFGPLMQQGQMGQMPQMGGQPISPSLGIASALGAFK